MYALFESSLVCQKQYRFSHLRFFWEKEVFSMWLWSEIHKHFSVSGFFPLQCIIGDGKNPG
jgi:hypothetical protein